MISVTDTQVMTLLQAWLWPFLRIASLVMTAPVIGTRSVPMRVRMAVAVAITAVLAPVLPADHTVVPLSDAGLLTAVQQIVIGATVGLVLRLVFAVIEFAGQILAQQMGLGFAAMMDPQSGAQVPVVSQFYIILATLLFFAGNCHLLLIRLLADSFDLLPVGTAGVTRAGIDRVLAWSGTLFSGAVLIALPMIVALLMVNLAFGVMARTAPQLNVFSVGFPVMIICGAVLMLLFVGDFGTAMQTDFDSAFTLAYRVLQER